MSTQQVDSSDPAATYTYSQSPSIAAIPGGYAVGWGTLTQECIRRYTSAGDAAAASCLDSPGAPKLAGLPNGDVVAILGSTARIEHADGSWSAPIPIVTDVDGTTTDFSATALADGTWVVAWMWYRQTAAGYEYQVRMRRFAANGTPLSDELPASATGPNLGNPGIGALADGGYVVAWTDAAPANNVSAQRFAANGSPVGGVINVGSPASWVINPVRVAGLAGGGFAILWRGDYAPRARAFAADGTPVSDAIDVDTPPDTPQLCGHNAQGPAYCRSEFRAGAIAGLADGGFVVAYTVENIYMQSPYMRARRFDAKAVPTGASSDVTPSEPTNRPVAYSAGVAGLPNDTLAFAWQYNQGTPTGIYFRLYPPDGLK